MLCINLAMGELEAANTILSKLLSNSEDKTLSEHFSENWQDKINTFIEGYLSQNRATVRQLGREEKKELILALKNNGAFKGKHAAQYIADSLKISRASVYGYIKE
jgi:predicted transcriptional regulator YheO